MTKWPNGIEREIGVEKGTNLSSLVEPGVTEFKSRGQEFSSADARLSGTRTGEAARSECTIPVPVPPCPSLLPTCESKLAREGIGSSVTLRDTTAGLAMAVDALAIDIDFERDTPRLKRLKKLEGRRGLSLCFFDGVVERGRAESVSSVESEGSGGTA
jgi:hypothetical protein